MQPIMLFHVAELKEIILILSNNFSFFKSDFNEELNCPKTDILLECFC